MRVLTISRSGTETWPITAQYSDRVTNHSSVFWSCDTAQYYPELADDEVVGGEESAGHQSEGGPRHLLPAARRHLTVSRNYVPMFLNLDIKH